jgi:hypothetical protein
MVLSSLALCWIAQGSGFESQRGHLFFGISPRGEISQEGFAQGLVSPPATSRYIGSVRIISEAPLVCLNGCYLLNKMGGWSFITKWLHKDNKLEQIITIITSSIKQALHTHTFHRYW